MWCNEFVIVEEPGISATALPKNRCYSTSSKEDTRRLRAVTKPNDEESCEKPHRGNDLLSCYIMCFFCYTSLRFTLRMSCLVAVSTQ